MEFAAIFLEYLLSNPSFPFTPALQKAAIENHKNAAAFSLEDIFIDGIPAKEAATEILEDMQAYFEGAPKKQHLVAQKKEKLNGVRLCEEIQQLFGLDYTDTVLALSREGRERVPCKCACQGYV